jgi:Predicted membrane protein
MTPIALNVLLILDVIGVLAFALTGLVEGVRKGADLFGIGFLAFVTAFGGGTVRDLLLDRRPFFWVENEFWLWLLIGIAILAPFILRSGFVELTSKTVKWPDAAGLGAFSANGTLIALESGESVLVAALMGVVTAAIGGIIRDLLLNRVPQAIIDHEFYLVIALAGGLLISLLGSLGVTLAWAAVIAATLVTITRMFAMTFGWRLPSLISSK